jgi:pseudouridine synthase
MVRHRSKPQSPSQRPLKTLERVLSKAGIGSRTEARRIIHARRVEVNGRVIENPDHWVDLKHDRVRLDGQSLSAGKKLYLLLYKPAGYLTTRTDPEGRPTVYDLLGDIPQWVFPVGRLDLETSGLLILTNDTALGETLTNPQHKVPKTYLVKTATLLKDAELEKLRRGVVLSDGPTLPAEVRRVRDSARHTWVDITITEGRNRQVRRMIEAIESKVLKLVRTRIGELEIGSLEIGRWREITTQELMHFQSRTGGAAAKSGRARLDNPRARTAKPRDFSA